MKKLLTMVISLLICVSLASCCMSHEWEDATCITPKTCAKCGETEGEALGHEWEDATCTTPKTCKVCGETDGIALGHSYEYVEINDYLSATTTSKNYCAACGEVMDEMTYPLFSFTENGKFMFTGTEFAQRLKAQLSNRVSDVDCVFELTDDGKEILSIFLGGSERIGAIAFIDENGEQMDESVETSNNIASMQLAIFEKTTKNTYSPSFQFFANEVAAAGNPSITGDSYTEYYAVYYILRNTYKDKDYNGLYYDCSYNIDAGMQIMTVTIAK